MTHPYFTTKARDILKNAGGNPDKAGPLAAWAEAARNLANNGSEAIKRSGVIITEDGHIQAETLRTAGQPSAHYITADTPHVDAREYEVKMGIGAIRRATGQQAIHVTYWDVCTGASAFTDDGEKLTATQAAAVVGVTASTFRSYVSRGQAPGEDGKIDGRTPFWYRSTIRAWRG